MSALPAIVLYALGAIGVFLQLYSLDDDGRPDPEPGQRPGWALLGALTWPGVAAFIAGRLAFLLLRRLVRAVAAFLLRARA